MLHTNQAHSCKYCWRGETESITYSDCRFVALLSRTQHAWAVWYLQLWPVWFYHIFFHIIPQTARFRKNVIECKLCVLIFRTNFVGNISRSKKNSARYRICTQIFKQSARYSCQILTKLEFSRQIFRKSNFTKIVTLGAEFFHADGQTFERA